MFRITNQLYLTNKTRLQDIINNPAHIIFLSPWKELVAGTELEGRVDHVEQLKQNGLGDRILFEIINEEIPHYNVDMFKKIIHLIDEYQKEQLIVVSTHGQSRAPSFILLWMAHYAQRISQSSLAAARMDFSRIYPNYIPWPGLMIFLNQEWKVLKEKYALKS